MARRIRMRRFGPGVPLLGETWSCTCSRLRSRPPPSLRYRGGQYSTHTKILERQAQRLTSMSRSSPNTQALGKSWGYRIVQEGLPVFCCHHPVGLIGSKVERLADHDLLTVRTSKPPSRGT